MDVIISFFRDIDGWPYYIMLVVNTILIFAIIGYLAEKNSEELMKFGMNTSAPEANNGTLNMTPTQTSTVTTGLSIPKVAATVASANPQVSNVQSPNTGAVNQVVSPTQNVSAAVPNPVNVANSNSVLPQNMGVVSQSATAQAQVGNNATEQAPNVLIINSPNGNKDVK